MSEEQPPERPGFWDAKYDWSTLEASLESVIKIVAHSLAGIFILLVAILAEFLGSAAKGVAGQPSRSSGRTYENRCWRCKTRISSQLHDRCTRCGWYHCGSCGACKEGCGSVHAGGLAPGPRRPQPVREEKWWDDPPPQGGSQLDDGSWYDPDE